MLTFLSTTIMKKQPKMVMTEIYIFRYFKSIDIEDKTNKKYVVINRIKLR